NTEHPPAPLFPDGESAFLSTDAAANEAEHGDAWPRAMAAIGAQAELAFGVLGTELWSGAGAGLAVTALRRLGRRGLVEFGAELVQSSRDWLATTFPS